MRGQGTGKAVCNFGLSAIPHGLLSMFYAVSECVLQMFMVVSQATGRPLSVRATFEKGLPATNRRHQPAPIEMQRI